MCVCDRLNNKSGTCTQNKVQERNGSLRCQTMPGQPLIEKKIGTSYLFIFQLNCWYSVVSVMKKKNWLN